MSQKPVIEVEVQGQLWFLNAGQYTEYLALFEDANILPKTFGRWHKLATHMRENLLRSGVIAIQVYARPQEFREFCVKEGIGLNAHAREYFAATKAGEKWSQSHPAHEDE